ncbi:hotdog fold domain-containing protein [Streptomyces neyagawaensis]|uniref:hotdog fold domain-containing protein n=1 Tax=Streptomyces neyagawaensis TaxID=42238 RepID=UPI0006E35090|nr:hotdog fold domain-containing protein [Streptomyces neyagawaensis]MCL6734593.1 hotdog fold thioesterase [Streptomyces neyagawaensis]MDE1685707.1 hotdog fold domain-containing protein [Streptomyces neyagawaensis]
MTTRDTIVVPELYVGYPGVAFGGYVAGTLAERSGAKSVRVDFRGPVPVEVPVRIAETADGGVELGEAERPLAAAHPAELPLDVPAAPSWDEAAAAAERFRATPPPGVVDCFGCGLRTADRGLRVYCGPVPGQDVVATAWTPSPVFADPDGLLPTRLVWGALDCPGHWAGRFLGTLRAGAVTASLTGTVLRPVAAGEPHLLYAWLLSESGRKHTMGVALTTPEGELCATSESLWIDPRPAS